MVNEVNSGAYCWSKYSKMKCKKMDKGVGEEQRPEKGVEGCIDDRKERSKI